MTLPPPGIVSTFSMIEVPSCRDTRWPYSFEKDVCDHLPVEAGDQYNCRDDITTTHETSHGDASFLRNAAGVGHNAFYLGGGHAVVVADPVGVTLADVAKIVPASLRGDRYDLYLVQQQRDWNSQPTYIIDEMVAYINGAACGLQIPRGIMRYPFKQVQRSLGHPLSKFPMPVTQWSRYSGSGVTDAMIGPIEFVGYLLPLAHLAKGDKQFIGFTEWLLKRACSVYRQGIVMPAYQWDRSRERALRTSTEARDILKELFGDRVTIQSLLGDQ